MRTVLVQLMKYSVVGGIAFVVDYGSLYVLTEFCGVYYLLSAAIAFTLGLTCNYCLSTKWVFGQGRVNNKFVEFVIFALIGIVGLGLNELIIYFFSDILNIHYMIGKIASTIIVFFWNFFARKYSLFKS